MKTLVNVLALAFVWVMGANATAIDVSCIGEVSTTVAFRNEEAA